MHKHTVVFSHGFGVRQDSRGMFTDIAAELQKQGIQPVLFDYNLFDNMANALTITPLDKQAEILNRIILDIRTTNPAGTIDLIGHSQGTVVIGLAHPTVIRKIILLAPPATLTVEDMKKMFLSRPGAQTDFNDLSIVPRRDGTTTIITPEYWKSIENLDPVQHFNDLAKITEVSVLQAAHDEVLQQQDFSKLSPAIKTAALDADHDFTGPARAQLIQTILSEVGQA